MIKSIHSSDITSFDLCAHAWRLQYVDGIVAPTGLATKIGTGVHKGIEINSRQKIATRNDEPLSVVQDAARDGYLTSISDEGVFFSQDEVGTAKKQIANGVDMTVSLAKVYRESFAETIQPIMVEHSFDILDNRLPIRISGRIDLFGEMDAGLSLIDIKTGSKRMSQDLADGSHQVSIYAKAIKDIVGAYPIVAFEQYLKAKSPFRHTVITERDDSDFDIVVKKIEYMLKMIEGGMFPPAPRGLAGYWKCSKNMCPYWYICEYIPAHKKVITTQWSGN